MLCKICTWALAGHVQNPYIGPMADDIQTLFAHRDAAKAQFFAHCDPGNLTPSQKTAYQFRDMALLLLLKAAQIELDAELELRDLIRAEAA